MIEIKVKCYLRYFRRLEGMTQQEIANKIGITRNAYAHIENGGDCKNSTAIALCSILCVTHENIWEVKEYKVE